MPIHASWASPSIVWVGATRASHVGPKSPASSQGWLLRYWRPSSTWNRASRPQSKAR
jgi:hypothetical protein